MDAALLKQEEFPNSDAAGAAAARAELAALIQCAAELKASLAKSRESFRVLSDGFESSEAMLEAEAGKLADERARARRERFAGVAQAAFADAHAESFREWVAEVADLKRHWMRLGARREKERLGLAPPSSRRGGAVNGDGGSGSEDDNNDDFEGPDQLDEVSPAARQSAAGLRRGPVHLQRLQAGAGSWQAGVPRAFGPARRSLSFAHPSRVLTAAGFCRWVTNRGPLAPSSRSGGKRAGSSSSSGCVSAARSCSALPAHTRRACVRCSCFGLCAG